MEGEWGGGGDIKKKIKINIFLRYKKKRRRKIFLKKNF